MKLFVLWRTGPCFYCGRETFRRGANDKRPDTYTRDHLIPKRLRRIGMQNVPGHLRCRLTVICCRECNRKKGQKEVFQFAPKLRYMPEKVKVVHQACSLNSRVLYPV